MVIKTFTYRTIAALLLCFLQVAGIDMYAQHPVQRNDSVPNLPKARMHRLQITAQDSLVTDSLIKVNEENLEALQAPADTASLAAASDSLGRTPERKIFIPNSTRSVWLAAIFPGAGQIYNRKYWKLPIIYGGFLGCAYALSWNNKMYSDYSQAYLDIMDNDPNTNSHLDFGINIAGKEEWAKAQFKRKKDFYRRNRDLSIFCFIGVYLISIIDAYVDAELSDFDISKDLGLKIEPVILNDRNFGNSIGLQCCIKF